MVTDNPLRAQIWALPVFAQPRHQAPEKLALIRIIDPAEDADHALQIHPSID